MGKGAGATPTTGPIRASDPIARLTAWRSSGIVVPAAGVPSIVRATENKPKLVSSDMDRPIRILLVADSHLGFDLPARPRVRRRRRGPDFLENYGIALRRALEGDVDLVIHGGDVFDRPRVGVGLAWQGLDPLVRVAESGIPVFVVPGNHERSRIPHARFLRHPRVHLFDRPRTYAVDVRGARVSVSGFPYERRDIRSRFPGVVDRTGWREVRASVRLLCIHHCVEGATVGPSEFTFRSASDVIRCADLPAEFAAVLSGHIHRHQVLARDLNGRTLTTQVLYPGSIEKTSYAEMGEPKGYILLDVEPDRVRWSFERLPARPMVVREIGVDGDDANALDRRVRDLISSCPADAILRIRAAGTPTDPVRRILAPARLRSIAPPTMTIEVQPRDNPFGEARRRPRSNMQPTRQTAPQLELGAGLLETSPTTA